MVVLVCACLSHQLAADDSAAARAARLVQEAAGSAEGGDHATAVGKLEAALELRPDFPQTLLALARACVAAERPEEAVAALERFAKLGLHESVEKAPEFAALKTRKDFQEVAKKIVSNLHPKGSGEIAFSLREVTGLIHAIAWREQTGEFYFGDVHHRAIWARNKDNTLRRVTAEGDDLLGVFALAMDDASGTLWAATAAVPEMRGFSAEQAGQAAVVEIDVATGEIRRSVSIPRVAGSESPHVLSDIALAADGSVYATDSAMPMVWRVARGATTAERMPESAEFFALHGIAIVAEDTALVADQINGLVRFDLRRGTAHRLESPADTTLVEIKGLTRSREGKVVVLQTGLRPSRVLSLSLDDTAEAVLDVGVLESGHIAMGSPSLGCLATGGDFYFIGNSGWSRFSSGSASPTAPRQVAVFRTKLGKKK